MSLFRWQHPCTFKDDDSMGARDILVWNDCNGPRLVSYASDEWIRFSSGFWSGWTLWRQVPPPSKKEIERAKRAGERAADRMFAHE